ncbi:uncharacterized protein LOC133483248 isoform X2 [Phyllopteryx taeniolatus]|uniref:uncharacterized protein LOC133483248 isoform X2 n=1 Tax=Phyllopteryx taeniolatus TaxID=161469 RepID=UPI002AD4A871|nr:uncharacterized protein LOC133483248 isoform X2 [Phyllopteryx taeniolatus]
MHEQNDGRGFQRSYTLELRIMLSMKSAKRGRQPAWLATRALKTTTATSNFIHHDKTHTDRKLKIEFIPTTFRMDLKEEREAFFAQQEGANNNFNQMWICKPTGLNQGRGIFLLRSVEDIGTLKLKLQHMDDLRANTKMLHRQPQAYVVQHYIQRPLLLRGKKFDVRSYLLIACTSPYMVFFRHGYVRLTCDHYDPSSNNLSAHLTNQYMQKKNPLYSHVKEDTVWSMECFNAYVNDWFQVAKALPRDWVLGAFTRCMQQIMTQCFFAVKPKLDRRLGFFDLIGCDFIVDEDFKVWLLEMNCNPALHVNCEVLKEVIPSTVAETLDLTLEIFNKCRLRKQILPLACQGEFVVLYNGLCSPDSNEHIEKGRKVTKKSQKTKPKKSVNYNATETPSTSLDSPSLCPGSVGRASAVQAEASKSFGTQTEHVHSAAQTRRVWSLGATRLQLSARSSRDDKPPPSQHTSVPHLEEQITHTAVLWGKSREELHQRIYSQQPIKGWEGRPAHMYGEIVHSSLACLHCKYPQEKREHFLVLFSFHLLLLSLDHTQKDFIYEVIPMVRDISQSPHMFEISSSMLEPKIFICSNAAELQTWMKYIKDRRSKSMTQPMSPSHCALSFLLPCDEHWKREELKKYLIHAPIWEWEGSPIQHMGPPGYISVVHIINTQRQGLQERLMILFPQDILLLSVDNKQLNITYQGRLPRQGVKATEKSARPGRLEFELRGELVEPLQVLCTCLDDYKNWIFHLQQPIPDRSVHTAVTPTAPTLIPKLPRGHKEAIITTDQYYVNGRS